MINIEYRNNHFLVCRSLFHSNREMYEVVHKPAFFVLFWLVTAAQYNDWEMYQKLCNTFSNLHRP